MKKINWRIVNIAFWIEILFCYVLPFQTTDNFQYQVGFPIPFVTVYPAKISVSPLMSLHLNPLGLFVNGVMIYLIISVILKIYKRVKDHKSE